MTTVIFENESLKVVESLDIYYVVADADKMRVVFNEDCKIDRICIQKNEDAKLEKRVKRLENELATYKNANVLLKKSLDKVRNYDRESDD